MIMAKRLLNAFVFGGCIALVGQLFLMIAAMIVPDQTLATIIAMLFFGFLGAILIASGIYDKLSKFADFGADQPLCGLMYGATMNTALAKAQGAPAGKAFFKGFCIVALIVGIGFVISAVLGAIIG